MESIRGYIRDKEEKQYVQGGELARRLHTTTNLEMVKIRKNQVKLTILNYAEMSYKQYVANPARRLTLRAEDTYQGNMRKYDTMIKKLYKCECDDKANCNDDEARIRNDERTKLLNTLRNTHPDKLDGSQEKRPDFQKAIEDLRKLSAKNIRMKNTRCEECETHRHMAERFLNNIKEVLSNALVPLSPQDFTSSIHYNKCYDKVLRADADKYMDGDLSKINFFC